MEAFMNMYRIKSIVICMLASTCIYTSTTLPRHYLRELTEESPKLQSAYNTANSLATACSKGFSYIKEFVTDYAVPYTVAGAKNTKEFIQNYAIPYSIAGAKHTKEFCKDCVIPALASALKAGYEMTQQLCQKIHQAYQQSKAVHINQHPQVDQQMPIQPADMQDQPAIVTPEPSAPPLDECGICTEPIIDNGVTLIPCGHHDLCGKCAKENFVTYKRITCPFCNQNVEDVVPTSTIVDDQEQPLIHNVEEAEEENRCICFEPLDHKRIKLEPCGHNLFCKACIDDNRACGRTNCPLCKQDVEKILEA